MSKRGPVPSPVKKSKGQKKSNSGGSVLSIIRCCQKSHNKSHAQKSIKNASAPEQICEKVGVSSSSCGHDSSCQTGINTFKMAPDWSIKFCVEGVEKSVYCSRHFGLVV